MPQRQLGKLRGPGDEEPVAGNREPARPYNVLQKLSYAAIVIVVIPGIILTGLTISPGVDSAWPWLLDVFGGHQTARQLHFCGTLVIAVFRRPHPHDDRCGADQRDALDAHGPWGRMASLSST